MSWRKAKKKISLIMLKYLLKRQILVIYKLLWGNSRNAPDILQDLLLFSKCSSLCPSVTPSHFTLGHKRPEITCHTNSWPLLYFVWQECCSVNLFYKKIKKQFIGVLVDILDMCLRLVQSQKCKQMLKHLFLKVYVWTICFPITKGRIQ